MQNHDRCLRRQVGDPAKELESITASIASVTTDLTAVNRALRSIPPVNLPWNICKCISSFAFLHTSPNVRL